MDNKDSYRTKIREQLDLWKKELKKLKQDTETTGAEVMKNLPDQIKILEKKIEEGTAKLNELVDTNEEAFVALREGIDSAWKSLSSGFSEAKEKFKWEKEKE
jgi:adenylosuccinate synthase